MKTPAIIITYSFILISFVLISFVLILTPLQVSGQDTWTPEQRQVLSAIERLSATTAPGGGGATAYGAVLSEEFSRWTIGSDLRNNKSDWVDGIRDWFDDGWRVSERNTRSLEILVRNNYAFTRRIVEETYLGPGDESSVSVAALAEVWIHQNSGWFLLYVNVHPMDSP